MIPLKEVVIFPFSITPLYVMPKQSLAALEAAMEADKRVFVLTQRSAQTEQPGPDDLYEFGVAAEIIQLIRLPDGSAKVLVEGHYIGRVLEYVARHAAWTEHGGWTDLFIRPTWTFAVVGALITNFHLPRSTLLMLVSAFAGRENVLAAYVEAVTRFVREHCD